MNLFFECNAMCFEIKAKFGIRVEFEPLNSKLINTFHHQKHIQIYIMVLLELISLSLRFSIAKN